MSLNLLAHPLLARIVVDIAPDYQRRIYMSKILMPDPATVTKIVEAVILGAIELAQQYGITVKGFEVTPPPIPGGPHATQNPSHG